MTYTSGPFRRRVLVIASGVCAAALPLVATPALGSSAAVDRTAPAVTMEPESRFVVGTNTFSNSYDLGGEPNGADWGATFSAHWTASDPSGICSQKIIRTSYDDMDGTTIPISKAARAYTYGDDVWTNARWDDTVAVQVTDCAGNTTTSTVANTVVEIAEDDSPAVAYTGTWKPSYFSGFSGGSTHYSTKVGDSLTAISNGGAVALVMEEAPNRGSADVYVDGAKRATINTYATTTHHQAVVWQSLLTAKAHTIKVVNKGTAGHPRIDLDLVLR